jgi:hypothetical protein
MSNGTTALRAAFRFIQSIPADKRTPAYVREHAEALMCEVDESIYVGSNANENEEVVEFEFVDPSMVARVQFGHSGARVALFDDSTEKWVAQ